MDLVQWDETQVDKPKRTTTKMFLQQSGMIQGVSWRHYETRKDYKPLKDLHRWNTYGIQVDDRG